MGQGHSSTAARFRTAGLTAALAGIALVTTGCQDVRNALGFDKSPPDEFRIVSRAPLSLPPDYSLRPPQPGAPRPQEPTQYDRARQAVIGQQATRGGAAGGSPGQTAFLSRSGADRADPTIRATVNREAGQAPETDETLLERLIYGRGPAEPLVDPSRESQRLREAQATGRAPNESETPTIQRRRRGLLEGIL